MTITTRAAVQLDGLTVGDLYQLVDLARASNVDPATEVEQTSSDPTDPRADGFEVELPALTSWVGSTLPPVTLSSYEAQTLAGVLETVIHKEGDARGELADLREWLDRLLKPYEAYAVTDLS